MGQYSLLTMAKDDVEAAVLMPLETPILKVSRPVAACSRCRNAKIKCDGKLPACSSCERNGRAAECTSTNDQFARGKERSYVSTLETRIDKLQAKLDEAKARKPSVVSIPDDETMTGSQMVSPQPVQPPVAPNTSKAQRRMETSAIDDLVSDFGFLSVNATARDFYGFTSAMSYARLILSACSKDALPQGTTKALPPRYAATQLIQHYLDNIFILLPVFDEASLYSSVEMVYANDGHKADPFDHWIVRMVLAIANATMSESRGDQHYLEGIGHVCAALEYAEEVLHPGSIAALQALVLLTQYATLDPHHFDSWNLIGAASRAMVDLGLHQDPPKGAFMPKAKLELRRRVFYGIYALDRSTSLVQTRAFSFSDDSANVKIPFQKSANSSAPTSPAPSGLSTAWLHSHNHASDLIELRRLQSIWYTDLFQSGRTRWDEPYPYIWNTCDAMRRWYDDLSLSTTPNMRAFFELELLYSYVYVLSPSPRVPIVAPFAQTLIFEYCIQYADLMLRLIDDPSYTSPLTFYDAMRIYMTGRQFLDVLIHNGDDLLRGANPSLPDVLPTTAPPPTLPAVSIPPGESPQRFNILRSINCIKIITECLSRFGIRWGYMSWNQRYQSETASMLEGLNERLRGLDALTGARRPSMWSQSSSTGTLQTTPASFSYSSSSVVPTAPPGPQVYDQHHIPLSSMDPAYGDPSAGQVGPQTFSTATNLYDQPTCTSPPPTQQYHPSQGFHQQPSQQFNFNDVLSAQPQANFATLPNQQFASWAGYEGPAQFSSLSEEHAVPP